MKISKKIKCLIYTFINGIVAVVMWTIALSCARGYIIFLANWMKIPDEDFSNKLLLAGINISIMFLIIILFGFYSGTTFIISFLKGIKELKDLKKKGFKKK